MTYLTSYQLIGSIKGPHLLLLGGVHGNEPCGDIALTRLLDDINAKRVTITHGTITIVPVCNPEARAQNTRYTETNLNRNLYPKEAPESYEDEVGNELCKILAQADLLVDFHSYRRGGPPFAFIGPQNDENEQELARLTGVDHIVDGFQRAYEAANIKVDQRESMGTTEYLRTQGGRGITVECGQHDDPAAVEFAYQAALRVLDGLGVAEITPDLRPPEHTRTPRLYHAHKVIYKERDGVLVRPFKNFESVEEGQIIARYEDGEDILCPFDGLVIMPDPRPDMPVGEEWVYLGREGTETENLRDNAA